MAANFTFQTIAYFNSPADPEAGLALDSSGNLFGVAAAGGANADGFVFELSAGAGSISTLASFGSADSAPTATLSIDASGDFYGTTSGDAFSDQSGGTGNATEFELAKGSGTIRTIETLSSDAYPGGAYLDTANNMLATVETNGENGYGELVVNSLSGGARRVAGFGGGSASSPFQVDNLVKFGSNLYGTTFGDGSSSNPGGIFAVNYLASSPEVQLAAIFSPTSTGYASRAGVIADVSGNLYGTTNAGAANGEGGIFEYSAGTHALSTLASFSASTGYLSFGALLRDKVGNLFGTTQYGGTNGYGTVFELKAGSSSISVLYSFTGGIDGATPYGALVADRNGVLYGTTSGENASGPGQYGTLFELANTGFVPVCYCTGTLIRTVRGDIAVEHLAVGDLVVTASGEQRPIRWLGHQTQRLAGPAQPRSAWPVRVAAGAFGDNKPDRDLFLSPGHSVCVGLFDEVLVPVQELVNGSTVAYVTDWTEVTYWHVELDSHDILIANNMPAESFLEMGENRAVFVEGRGLGDPSAEVVGRTHADFCRRFVDGGPLLATMREELRLRAERLGWQPERTVALACQAGGQVIQPLVVDGTAVFALPAGVGELRIGTATFAPALLGEADMRTLGLAIYTVSVRTAAGDERVFDLDDPTVRECFHPGERREGLHYRWSRGELVLPASFTAGLDGPLMLRVSFEPGTIRGWSEPAHRVQKPTLRVVA